MEAMITVEAAGLDKEGVKNGKTWRRYFVKDSAGEVYKTFDGALFNAANAAVGKNAAIVYEIGQYGFDLKHLEAVAGSPTFAPPAPAAKTPQGDTDWDLIGLRKTRCALWATVLPVLCRDLHFDDAQRLLVRAENDIFSRAPAGDQDDIPF